MTLIKLKGLFQDQQLVEAIIEPTFIEAGWMVSFRHHTEGLLVLTDLNGEACRYTRLESASEAAMAVGFDHVRVIEK
jgi:hypothetical protein